MKGVDKLVLFDFDGTITNKDTLFTFTRFAVGDLRFYVGLLLLLIPLVLQKIKLLSAHKAKEIFLSYFFKGQPLIDFDKTCHQFTKISLTECIRSQAITTIKSYQQSGSRIIIVSASPTNWILPWASSMGIEVIATLLEINQGKLTGRLSGKNCNGDEKVQRIKEHLNLQNFSEIIVYGDSAGDKQMLQLATKQYYKPFRGV